MKTLKWIIVILLATIGVLYVYLSNTELFYSEYWLQRKIINTEQERTQLKLSKRQISYRFHHDMVVDIEISLSDNGVLQLTRGEWISADVVMNKELEYQLDLQTFENLRTEFLNNWNESLIKSEEYKLGGTYYELSLLEPGNKPIEIRYINYIPSDTLSNFKNQLIEISTAILDNEYR